MATTGPALKEGDHIGVTIYVDGNGKLKVDPPTFEISKGEHQDVLWQTNPPGADFTVNFGAENTPFQYPDFNKDNPYSGEVKRKIPAGDGTYYKYTVTAFTQSIDPGGHVNP